MAVPAIVSSWMAATNLEGAVVTAPDYIIRKNKSCTYKSAGKFVMCSCSFLKSSLYREMKGDEQEWKSHMIDKIKSRPIGVIKSFKTSFISSFTVLCTLSVTDFYIKLTPQQLPLPRPCFDFFKL